MLAAWLLQDENWTGSRVIVPMLPPLASIWVLMAARLPSTAGEIRPSKAIFLPASEPPRIPLSPLAMPAPTPLARGLVENQ